MRFENVLRRKIVAVVSMVVLVTGVYFVFFHQSKSLSSFSGTYKAIGV